MNWYIIKNPQGHCEIISSPEKQTSEELTWGPFSSQEEAIVRRVGLIRAGKCQLQ